MEVEATSLFVSLLSGPSLQLLRRGVNNNLEVILSLKVLGESYVRATQVGESLLFHSKLVLKQQRPAGNPIRFLSRYHPSRYHTPVTPVAERQA